MALSNIEPRAPGGSRTRHEPFRRRQPFRWASRARATPFQYLRRADRESNPGPRFCRPRSSPEIRLMKRNTTKHRERWRRIELPSRAWHARTLPLSYHRKTAKRAAGIEPASTVWKTVALPLDDARVRLFQTVTLLLPLYLRAARENCTHHLLHTRQAPRYLGLGSDRGATGSRTPIPAVRKQCSSIELSSHSDGHLRPTGAPEEDRTPLT